MFDRLKKIEQRYRQLEELLISPETLQNKNLYSKYAKEFAGLNELMNKYKEYKSVLQEIDKVAAMLKSTEHQKDKDFFGN